LNEVKSSETPDHSYENGGNYVIKLMAINGNLIDSISKNIQITDKYFTDLNDTLISVQWANWGKDFNLDLDKDSIDDIKFTVYSYYSKLVGSEDYLQITPLNGFKLAFTNHQTTTWTWNPNMIDKLFKIDTVMVPKVFNLGDTISMDDMYSVKSQMIYYDKTPSIEGSRYSSGLSYGIKKGEYFYLGLYKSHNKKSRLAWLKVRPILYGVVLNSSCYIDEEKVIIKKKL